MNSITKSREDFIKFLTKKFKLKDEFIQKIRPFIDKIFYPQFSEKEREELIRIVHECCEIQQTLDHNISDIQHNFGKMILDLKEREKEMTLWYEKLLDFQKNLETVLMNSTLPPSDKENYH